MPGNRHLYYLLDSCKVNALKIKSPKLSLIILIKKEIYKAIQQFGIVYVSYENADCPSASLSWKYKYYLQPDDFLCI